MMESTRCSETSDNKYNTLRNTPLPKKKNKSLNIVVSEALKICPLEHLLWTLRRNLTDDMQNFRPELKNKSLKYPVTLQSNACDSKAFQIITHNNTEVQNPHTEESLWQDYSRSAVQTILFVIRLVVLGLGLTWDKLLNVSYVADLSYITCLIQLYCAWLLIISFFTNEWLSLGLNKVIFENWHCQGWNFFEQNYLAFREETKFEFRGSTSNIMLWRMRIRQWRHQQSIRSKLNNVQLHHTMHKNISYAEEVLITCSK